MHHSSRKRELSLLAQGRGFYGHGVQVECFVDDFKAYSLGGRPFVRSSASGRGRSCKQYRNHTLTLPKTYVTKRGQMVLFTAPEDMIMGQSCSMHQKEIISRKTVQELKTTHNFANSAMTYGKADAPIYDKSDLEEWAEPEAKGAWPETKGAWQDEREVKAGHFTDVYLRSLQKATAHAHSKAHDDFTVVEDLEEKDFTLDAGNKKALGEDLQMDVEAHLIPECDSGLGQSIGHSPSGRLSNHSQRSELSTVISIPHGSMSEEEMWSPLAEVSPQRELMSRAQGAKDPSSKEDDGGLAALKQELGFYKVKGAGSATDPKKQAKTGKKRQHPKSTSSKTGADTASNISSTSKPKTKKIVGNKASALENISSSKLDQLRSGHVKPSKVKKRRGGKKQLFSQEDENVDPMVVEGDIQESQSPTMAGKEEVHTAVQGHVTGNGLGLDDGGPLEITGVHLGMGEGEEFPIKSRRPSRAEERKLETERKRLEKREMERLRKQEKEEEQRLKEEKEIQSQSTQDLGGSDDSDDTADAIETSSPEPPSPPPLSNQQQLLDALQRAKLRENTLLLSLRMESSDRLLTDEIKSVEEAVERARRAAEELERKREDEERQSREEEECLRAKEERKRLEKEAIQDALDKRAQSIQNKSARLKSECMKAVDVERKTKRYRDTVAPSIMFSYFSYVPPPGNRKKSEAKAPKRGQRPQTIRSK